MTAPWRVLVILLVLAVVASPLGTDAQAPGKVPRVGALVFVAPPFTPVDAFRQALRDLGYVEGSTVAVEARCAEGRPDRYPGLVAEIVGLHPDVIVVWGTELAGEVRRATTTIPIVLAVADRPVEMGLVATLARPGGNVTGLTSLNFELAAKRLELLKEALPKTSRVGVLHGPDSRIPATLTEMAAAARALGVQLQPVEVRRLEELDRALDDMVRQRAGAFVVLPGSPAISANYPRLADLALKRRLPMVVGGRLAVAAGGVMGYAASADETSRRAATFVDKILKGARPADLPVEQPTRFEPFINLKTARALGLTIPPTMLARADELIE